MLSGWPWGRLRRGQSRWPLAGRSPRPPRTSRREAGHLPAMPSDMRRGSSAASAGPPRGTPLRTRPRGTVSARTRPRDSCGGRRLRGRARTDCHGRLSSGSAAADEATRQPRRLSPPWTWARKTPMGKSRGRGCADGRLGRRSARGGGGGGRGGPPPRTRPRDGTGGQRPPRT